MWKDFRYLFPVYSADFYHHYLGLRALKNAAANKHQQEIQQNKNKNRENTEIPYLLGKTTSVPTDQQAEAIQEKLTVIKSPNFLSVHNNHKAI